MSKRADANGANRRVLRRSVLVALIMFAFGFALAPFYDAICRTLGIGGKTGTANEPVATAGIDKSRTVTVELTGHAMSGLPWEFRPLVKKIEVHPGQPMTVSYYVRNTAGERIVGRAVPSVTPSTAAAHFNKIECFCFTEQPLGPGESREMPVRFVVEKALPPQVRTLTLSYGFFNIDKAQAKRFGGEALSATPHGAHGG